MNPKEETTMELNSPRKDPYSTFAIARKDLIKKGYEAEFTIMDEKSAVDDGDKHYKPNDLRIDHIIRIPERKNRPSAQMYANDVTKQKKLQEVKAIYALSAENGTRGILTEHNLNENSEVVDRFLQNVDRHDSLQENYTA